MKKINKIIIALLVFLLVLPLNSVFADNGSYEYVKDYAPLLSDEDARELSAMGSGTAAQYGVGTYIVTVENKGDLGLADYDAADVAEMVYEAMELGYGSQKDGVMLFFSYDEPDFCVYASGPNAEKVFTPEICADLTDSFIENIDSSESWYELFCSFMFEAEFELQWAVRQSSGEDFDYEDYEDYDYYDDYSAYAAVGAEAGNSTKTRSTGGSSSLNTASLSVDPDDAESIIDGGKILSSSELDRLEQKAAALENKYTITVDGKSSKVGIYIVTLEDRASIGAQNYLIYELSEALYEAWEFGVGDDKNGILLLMDMSERDFDIVAHGFAGNYTFTDYAKDRLVDAFADDFGENDWYEGFDHYLDEIERQLMWAEKGDPVDVGSESEKLRNKIGIPGIVSVSLLIGLLFALIVCTHFKNQMKSVRPAASAADFAEGKGIEYTQKADDFLRTTTSTRVIESKSSSGGTSVNSGGYSHRSGKF
ncbi:MAG: TPM domain-containing protein [Spirochaetaceae bacterium]|nr:TPM domain-containing protein [Spirochaetaceae bacterium]